MPIACRQTDLTIHGGTVATGSPDVMIGNQPAARVDDGHICPLHPGGPISQGSSTVLINNVPAARVGDKVLCTPGALPPGGATGKATVKYEPDKIGEKEKAYGDDAKKEKENEGKPKEKPKPEWKGIDVEKKFGEVKAEGEVGKFAGEHGKVLSGKASADAKASANIKSLREMKAEVGVNAAASGSVVSMEGKTEGKYGKGEASAEFLSAEAKAKAGASIDTKKGEGNIGVEAGAGASVFKAEAKGETAGWRIPFTDWEIGVSGGVEGTLLGVEAKGHAGISWNKKDGFRMGAGGKVSAFLAGLGISFGLFIRPAKKEIQPAPDMLAKGWPTVLIGDNSLAEKKQRLAERKALIENARKKANDPATSPEEKARLEAAADRLERNNESIERARLASHVYTADDPKSPPPPAGWSQMSPEEMKELGVDPKTLQDPRTGYKANIYKSELENPPKIVVAFAGTDDIPDVVTDVRQGVGVKDGQYDKAMDLTSTVANGAKGKGYVVETTGHSLGGGLASAGSAVTGVRGNTYNAAGLHDRTTRRNYSTADRAANARNVTAYHNTSDPLNNFQDGVGLAADAYGNRVPVAPAPQNRHSWWDLVNLNPLKSLGAIKDMALDGHGMGQMIEAIEAEKSADVAAMGGTP